VAGKFVDPLTRDDPDYGRASRVPNLHVELAIVKSISVGAASQQLCRPDLDRPVLTTDSACTVYVRGLIVCK
jgi:hypothetical protein